MASAFPYFKWFVADAETDEFYGSLTFEEKGFYHECLNKAWINEGLPSDLNKLANLLRVKRSYLDKIWSVVGQAFTLTDTVVPRYVDGRQEKEREEARKRSEANKRPGNANAKGSRSVRESIGAIRASDSDSSPATSNNKSEEGTEDSRVIDIGIRIVRPFAMDEAFIMFMSEVEQTGAPLIEADYDEAFDEWKPLGNDEKQLAVLSFREKREAGLFANPTMVMRPAKWLRRKEFNRRTVKPRDSPASLPKHDQLREEAKRILREQEAANGHV